MPNVCPEAGTTAVMVGRTRSANTCCSFREIAKLAAGSPVATSVPPLAKVWTGRAGHVPKSPFTAAIAPCALAIALVRANVPKVLAESATSSMTAFDGSTVSTRILKGPLGSLIRVSVSPGARVVTRLVTPGLSGDAGGQRRRDDGDRNREGDEDAFEGPTPFRYRRRGPSN